MDVGALSAANKLALQRMEMFKEDSATANKVTKRPSGKNAAANAPWMYINDAICLVTIQVPKGTRCFKRF